MLGYLWRRFDKIWNFAGKIRVFRDFVQHGDSV